MTADRRRSSALSRRHSSLVMQVTGVLPSAQLKTSNVFLKYVEFGFGFCLMLGLCWVVYCTVLCSLH